MRVGPGRLRAERGTTLQAPRAANSAPVCRTVQYGGHRNVSPPVESYPAKFEAQSFLRTLTNDPGVYRLLDRLGRILYVGKARSLKKRVASYFRLPEQLPPKTRALMSHTDSVEVTVTHTETEALLLENNLIKEHRPHYQYCAS